MNPSSKSVSVADSTKSLMVETSGLTQMCGGVLSYRKGSSEIICLLGQTIGLVELGICQSLRMDRRGCPETIQLP